MECFGSPHQLSSPLPPAPVALADLVQEVGDIYEPIAENKSITLHVDLAQAPTVVGDRDLLMEAIVNLVDNAVKFTPEGGRVEIALLRGNAESIVRIRHWRGNQRARTRCRPEAVLSIRQTEKRTRIRPWPQSCDRDSQATLLSFDYSARLRLRHRDRQPGSTGCWRSQAGALKSLRPVAAPNKRVSTE
ncbi:hypothetical protein V1281_000025 [Nitrobacteraceae bacterium AZCC 2161]